MAYEWLCIDAQIHKKQEHFKGGVFAVLSRLAAKFFYASGTTATASISRRKSGFAFHAEH